MKVDGAFYRQDGKTFAHLNDTNFYFENLEFTYRHIEEGVEAHFLYFAFITLCSATLEASLNHIIFSFYLDKFGPIEYKKYAESLINIGFSNKLHTIPVIVSNSEFQFDSNCFTIKKLDELIVLRNRILHKTPVLQETEYDMDKMDIGMKMIFKSNNHIQSIDKKQCANFYKAMLSFRDEFMYPLMDRNLVQNKLLKKV